MDNTDASGKKISQGEGVGKVVFNEVHNAKISFFVGSLLSHARSFS